MGVFGNVGRLGGVHGGRLLYPALGDRVFVDAFEHAKVAHARETGHAGGVERRAPAPAQAWRGPVQESTHVAGSGIAPVQSLSREPLAPPAPQYFVGRDAAWGHGAGALGAADFAPALHGLQVIGCGWVGAPMRGWRDRLGLGAEIRRNGMDAGPATATLRGKCVDGRVAIGSGLHLYSALDGRMWCPGRRWRWGRQVVEARGCSNASRSSNKRYMNSMPYQCQTPPPPAKPLLTHRRTPATRKTRTRRLPSRREKGKRSINRDPCSTVTPPERVSHLPFC